MSKARDKKNPHSSSHLIWFVNYCFVNLGFFLLICISFHPLVVAAAAAVAVLCVVHFNRDDWQKQA